jgi:hypothetical protein
VDVQPVHALAPRGVAGVLEHLEVARLRDELERLESGDRMGAGGGDPDAVLARGLVGGGAERPHGLERLGRVGADVGVELDDRGVQLGLEPPGERPPVRCGQHRRNLGHGQQRLGVEEHDLFLHPERERRALAPVRLDHASRSWRAAGRPGGRGNSAGARAPDWRAAGGARRAAEPGFARREPPAGQECEVIS